MTHRIVNLMQKAARRLTPLAIDAAVQPAEVYYAGIYLDEIKDRLRRTNGKPLKVLDAGCGAGRIMIPIAKLGHAVTGIDYHHDSLRLARLHLDEAGVRAELIEADLVDALKKIEDASYDAAMAIESIYISEHYETILDHLTRIVRPGGLLFITHRTRYFYLTRALAQGHYDDLPLITHSNSGRIRKGHHRVYHHWESRQEILSGYTSRGLELLKLQGIGVCSGFGDDPLACLCDPGNLTEAQKRLLREVETCDDDLVMAGRYVFAVVRKP